MAEGVELTETMVTDNVEVTETITDDDSELAKTIAAKSWWEMKK